MGGAASISDKCSGDLLVRPHNQETIRSKCPDCFLSRQFAAGIRNLTGRRAATARPIFMRMFRVIVVFFMVFAAPALAETAAQATMQPVPRDVVASSTRWTHQRDHLQWNQAAHAALNTHGRPLVDMVPGDIATWCPGYGDASDNDRAAFWVGFMSALAKHESTYKAGAVGGGGRWFGLLQISPGTARGYRCEARSGQALRNGEANLSCAIRIMAVTVPRDGVIHGHDGKWRGVSADWGPMRSSRKRADMADWLRQQPYCLPTSTARPRLRAFFDLLTKPKK